MGRSWIPFGKAKNDHEAGSSRRAGRRSPPPPRRNPAPATSRTPAPATSRTPAPATFRLAPPATEEDRRVRPRPYLNKRKCQWYWDNAIPVPWTDVHLAEGWHLNPERIPVPPVPRDGLAREVEIRRRREDLPEDLRYDPAFAVNSPHWDTWFTDEHDLRRRSFFGARRARGPAAYPPPSPPRPGRALPPLRIAVEEEEDAASVKMEEGEEEDDDDDLAKAIAASAQEAAEAARLAAEEEARDLRDALAAVAAKEAAEAEEAAEMEVELAREAPPPAWFMPMVGMAWEWTGPPPSVAPPAPEQPATPPRASRLPAHLVQDPDYVVLE